MMFARHLLLGTAPACFALTLAACSGSGPDPQASTTSGGELAAGPQGSRVHAGFVTTREPEDESGVVRATVALELRDETGATVRAELGSFLGCGDAAPTDASLLTLTCFFAGTGDALHLVRVGDELVVQREDLAEELTNAPRIAVQRFTLAPGATLDVAP